MCFRNSLLNKHWHNKIWDNLSIQAYMAKILDKNLNILRKKGHNNFLFWKVKVWLSVFSIGITLVDVLLNWLNWFHLLFLEGGLLVIMIDCLIFLSPSLDVTRISLSTVSSLTQLNSGILCLYNAFLWPRLGEEEKGRRVVTTHLLLSKASGVVNYRWSKK